MHSPKNNILLGWVAWAGLVALVSTAATTAAAQAPPRPAAWQGLWTGKSVIWEKPLNDAVRKLTRTSDADFWFVVDASGQVHGEGFVTYQAELKAIKWKVPLPNGGTIDAEVAGSSGKQIFKFGIGGQVVDKQGGRHPQNHETCPFEISLQALGDQEGQPVPEQDGNIPGISFTFSIDASVTVPAGMGGGVAPGAQPGIFSIPMPAKGWSPFQGLHPDATVRPGEPARVMAQSRGEKHFILWYAVKQSQ